MFLEVTDDGTGMDEQTRARIFDPFYTTKFTGRGLGLSAVAGIVNGHGGRIRVESSRERGTSFTVLFPTVASRSAEPSELAAATPGGASARLNLARPASARAAIIGSPRESDLRAKVSLVLPLDLGHSQQLRDETPVARENRETRGFLVLADVAALEPPRAVHREEATRSRDRELPMTSPIPRKSASRSLRGRAPRSSSISRTALRCSHLLDRDRRYLLRFRRVHQGSRMAFVRESRRELARVSSSQNGNELEESLFRALRT